MSEETKPSVNMHVEHITKYLSKEEQEKLSLKDLLFVKDGDYIIGHDMHGSDVVAQIFEISEDELSFSYGNKFMRGVACLSRETCIRRFGKYRPRVTFEHMEKLIKKEIVERCFEEKYDGLYLLPWYEAKKPKESDYDFGHENVSGDYMDIMRTAANKIVDLSFSNDNLEVCEVLAQLAKDAAMNAREYLEMLLLQVRKER